MHKISEAHPLESDPEKLKYLKWLRGWEYYNCQTVFPEGEPFMLFRGLKSIYYIVGEITRNDGLPLKGAIWVTNDYSYAVRFGPAYVLHINPQTLGEKYPGYFIKDKPETFTTGQSVNLYSCLFLRSKQILYKYLLTHFPELYDLKDKILEVLELPGYQTGF